MKSDSDTTADDNGDTMDTRNETGSRPRKRAHRPRKIEAEEMREILGTLSPAWAVRLRRMRALGMHQRQMVFEMHCREGRSLREIAEALGVTRDVVGYHWRQVQAQLAQNAPRTAEQLTAVREEIATRLWATVEQTYGRTEVFEEGTMQVQEAPPTPPLLAIRLRALEQLSKLYGVAGELPPAAAATAEAGDGTGLGATATDGALGGAAGPPPLPFSLALAQPGHTPPLALSEAVRLRQMGRWQRG